MTPSRTRAALYARVSTEQQARTHTIATQVDAIKHRISRKDGLDLRGGTPLFVDDGYSGEALERPALERLRDQIAAGAVDRIYIHSPDRLARKYAYQVLLIEEFRRAGVETIFLNHPVDPTPEGELLLQVQGIIAEYERAKILERSRRGKRGQARSGAVSVFSQAPYGYRYISKQEGDGVARFEVEPGESEDERQESSRWFAHCTRPAADPRDLPAAGLQRAQDEPPRARSPGVPAHDLGHPGQHGLLRSRLLRPPQGRGASTSPERLLGGRPTWQRRFCLLPSNPARGLDRGRRPGTGRGGARRGGAGPVGRKSSSEPPWPGRPATSAAGTGRLPAMRPGAGLPELPQRATRRTSRRPEALLL